jgi:hypothetical protein
VQDLQRPSSVDVDVFVWRIDSSEPEKLLIEVKLPAASAAADSTDRQSVKNLRDAIVAKAQLELASRIHGVDGMRLAPTPVATPAVLPDGSCMWHIAADTGLIDGAAAEYADGAAVEYDVLFKDITKFWFLDDKEMLDTVLNMHGGKWDVHAYIAPSRPLSVQVVDFGNPSGYLTKPTVTARAVNDVREADKGEYYVWWSKSPTGELSAFVDNPVDLPNLDTVSDAYAAGIYRIGTTQQRIVSDSAPINAGQLQVLLQAQKNLLQSFAQHEGGADVVCFSWRAPLNDDNDDDGYIPIPAPLEWDIDDVKSALERRSDGAVLMVSVVGTAEKFLTNLFAQLRTTHDDMDIWMFFRSSDVVYDNKRDARANIRKWVAGSNELNERRKVLLCEMEYFATMASRSADGRTWEVVHYKVEATGSVSGLTSPRPSCVTTGGAAGAASTDRALQQDQCKRGQDVNDQAGGAAGPKSRRRLDGDFVDGQSDDGQRATAAGSASAGEVSSTVPGPESHVEESDVILVGGSDDESLPFVPLREPSAQLPDAGGAASQRPVTGRQKAAHVVAAVGAALGAKLGAAVGAAEGTVVGDAVGAAVGSAVGRSVGNAVGEAVGLPDGVADGVAVGPAEGLAQMLDDLDDDADMQAAIAASFQTPRSGKRKADVVDDNGEETHAMHSLLDEDADDM